MRFRGRSLSCKGAYYTGYNAFGSLPPPRDRSAFPIYAIIPSAGSKLILLEQLNALTAEQQGFVRLRARNGCHFSIGWLKEQPLFPRIYWHARERDHQFAVLGAIRELMIRRNWLASPTTSPTCRQLPALLRRLAFDYTSNRSQRNGGSSGSAVLSYHALTDPSGNQTELVCNLWFDGNNQTSELTAAREALQQLQPESTLTHYLPAQRGRRHPDKPRWMQWLSQVLQPKP